MADRAAQERVLSAAELDQVTGGQKVREAIGPNGGAG
jgi:hypothetical protein